MASDELTPEFKDARAAALSAKPRFEVFEHNDRFYAVRQSNGTIAKAIAAVGDNPIDRVIQIVMEATFEAIPVKGEDGKQVEEPYTVPIFEPVLDGEGKPQLEAIHDATGRPIVVDGKALMRPVMRLKVDEAGVPVMEQKTRPAFTMGRKMFARTDRDLLLEGGMDDDSFIGKASAAWARVNDQEAAKARAKKS